MSTLLCRSASIGLLLLGFSVFAWGQATAPSVAPPGPILAKPASAQWQLTISADKVASGSAVPETTLVVSKSIAVSGNIRHEEITDAAGGRTSIWCQGDAEYYKMSPSNEFVSCSPDDFQHYIAKSKYVFSELDWVSSEDFVGIKKVNDKPCLVFGEPAQSLSASQVSDLLAPENTGKSRLKKAALQRVVYIDATTRLPLFFQEGAGNYVYQFGTAPAAPLVLPDEIAALLKLRDDQTKRLGQQPARS